MSTIPIRLLHDFVLIKRIPMPDKTKSGLILPLKAVEIPQLGHVVAIGPKNPDQILVGEMVMFKRFEGHRLVYNDAEFHLLKIEDLLLAITEG